MTKVIFTLGLILVVSGCVKTVGSGTEAVCSLQKDLPTVSREDTDRTIIEVDNFTEKFLRACRVALRN